MLETCMTEVYPCTRLRVGTGRGVNHVAPAHQDAFCVLEGMAGGRQFGLFLVADGVVPVAPGIPTGCQAVSLVSEAVLPVLVREPKRDEALALLVQGVGRANAVLYAWSREFGSLMSTAMTAALILQDVAYLVHTGTTRAYFHRLPTGLMPLTRDSFTPLPYFPLGNLVRSVYSTQHFDDDRYCCLGESPTPTLDCYEVPLQEHDVLLLTTDDLQTCCGEDTMNEIIGHSRAYPHQMSTMLVHAALNRGMTEQVSVVAISVTDVIASPSRGSSTRGA
jgi:serine/threonine protein phosphatase PrpC